MLSTAATVLQLGGFAVLFAGDSIFNAIGITPPALYYQMKEKKTMAFFFLFMGFNWVKGMITSTGAFEVYANEKLVFSKLKMNRMPDMQEILKLVE
jgi:selT/selW/selH-like putative selenoprotein